MNRISFMSDKNKCSETYLWPGLMRHMSVCGAGVNYIYSKIYIKATILPQSFFLIKKYSSCNVTTNIYTKQFQLLIIAVQTPSCQFKHFANLVVREAFRFLRAKGSISLGSFGGQHLASIVPKGTLYCVHAKGALRFARAKGSTLVRSC